MNIVIHELRMDHQNFQRVLKLIRYLVNLAAGGNWPEAAVGGGINALQKAFEYMVTYVPEVHHRKEDLIFEAFTAHSAVAIVNLDRMRTEHHAVNDSVCQIRDIFMQSAYHPQQNEKQLILLKDKMNRYFQMRMDHMQFEEISIYPLVETALSINDWKDIIQQSPKTDDPAFGHHPLADFQPLADAVINLERVNLTPGWELR